MKYESVGSAVLRIELVHGLLVLVLLLFLAPGQYLEPRGLIFGGLFVGLNFLLLGHGIRRVLTPFAGKGRVRSGVLLLTLKLIFFLGLVLFLFFRVHIDPLSFAAGVTSLLVAIVLQGFWSNMSYQEIGE
ncbi:MAG: hypothetical protein ACE5I0_11170 [Candidatus Binatia bacterium]